MPNQIQNDPNKASQTTQAVNHEDKAEQGYGACSYSGCNCKGYQGSGDTCGNCGHNYATHW